MRGAFDFGGTGTAMVVYSQDCEVRGIEEGILVQFVWGCPRVVSCGATDDGAFEEYIQPFLGSG